MAGNVPVSAGSSYPVTTEADLVAPPPALNGPVPAGAAAPSLSGTLIAATVSSGSVLTVSGTMSAAGTVIHSGGEQLVVAGGTAGLEQIQAGGLEVIADGGSTFAPEFYGSGTVPAILVVSAGGSVSAANLFSGGAEFVLSGGADSRADIGIGSFLEVANGGTASGEVIGAAGVMAVAPGAVITGPIRFGHSLGSSGYSELILSGTSIPALTIGGFDVSGRSQNDTIALPDITYDPNGTVSVDATTHQMMVVEGGTTVDLSLIRLPSVAGELQVSAAPDPTGGTDIFAACFAAGTAIATATGAAAVEALTPGMTLRLASGGTAPVVWVGHRAIDLTRHPCPDAVRPVRIAPHAFGIGRPARTLWLSPDHAVFVDDVLIPVRHLLNAATVAQETVRHITYFHVELPAHGVLLAEGLPVESYLDTGNRAAFANGGGAVMAHPDFARVAWATSACAPLVTDGPVRDRVYRRLIAQALALGWTALPGGGPERIVWRAPRRLRTA